MIDRDGDPQHQSRLGDPFAEQNGMPKGYDWIGSTIRRSVTAPMSRKKAQSAVEGSRAGVARIQEKFCLEYPATARIPSAGL